MNEMKTFLLIAAMTALFGVVGFFVGGATGMLIALGIAAAMNVFAYWNADKMILSHFNAREVDAASAPEFYGMIRELAARGGLPMPKVYIINQAQPNAFATGRDPNNAAVAATTGLLQLLDRREVMGVMAHELAHVRNRDTLIMTVTATIAGAIGALANFAMFAGMFGGNREENNNPLGLVGTILVSLLAPIAASIVQFAISRSREYGADRVGAELCGDPLALASALAKIEAAAKGIDMNAAERNPAMAHLFIINPLHAHAVDNLFSTHPNTQNRIAQLHRLAAAMGAGGAGVAARGAPGPAASGPWGGGMTTPGTASGYTARGTGKRPWNR